MQEVDEKKISENMMELVDLIYHLDDVIKYLREKDVLTEEEEQEIIAQEALFNKKSHLLWIIKKKDNDETFSHLKDALKSTGNDAAADKLSSSSGDLEQTTSPSTSANHIVETEVTVEHQQHQKQQQPDQEGMALAVEIEKEFERIQCEVDKEAGAENGVIMENEEVVDGPSSPSLQYHVEERQYEEPESDVRVEITAPEPEIIEGEETEEGEIQQQQQHQEQQVMGSGDGDNVIEEITQHEEEKVVETVDEVAPESPRPQKQVTFGDVTQPEEDEEVEEQKEFVNADDEGSSARETSESPSDLKSIVALNREKFEKSSPNGGPPKVKYSFKKGGVTGRVGSPSEDEPKESTVKNLRNFFQKLGSVDAEEGSSVLKRPGVRANGAQNRRTMI